MKYSLEQYVRWLKMESLRITLSMIWYIALIIAAETGMIKSQYIIQFMCIGSVMITITFYLMGHSADSKTEEIENAIDERSELAKQVSFLKIARNTSVIMILIIALVITVFGGLSGISALIPCTLMAAAAAVHTLIHKRLADIVTAEFGDM